LAKAVSFCVTSEVGNSIITGSRKALSGALLNLLENALQACEGRYECVAEVKLDARTSGRYLRISVRDTGGGIAPEAHERVFEPFFTTRGQGTGLGLAIALGVARAHGGSIEVNSVPGQGSEFVMLLPVGKVDQQNFEDSN
jgi:two-component system sensor histidine kinase FlrB